MHPLPYLLEGYDTKSAGYIRPKGLNQTGVQGANPKLHQFLHAYMVHTCKPDYVDYFFFTETDLRQIHRAFCQPSIRSTENLLKRSNGGNLEAQTRRLIRNIGQSCQSCQQKSGPPRRFKLTIGTSNLRFNHSVKFYTMYLDEIPVLHLVDQGTHFCGVVFLQIQYYDHVWQSIVSCWSHVY